MGKQWKRGRKVNFISGFFMFFCFISEFFVRLSNKNYFPYYDNVKSEIKISVWVAVASFLISV